MSCSEVVKRVMRFPFRGGLDGLLTAIDAPSVKGEYGRFNADGTTEDYPSDDTSPSVTRGLQKLVIPRPGLRAISIADDSPIAECVIAVGGNSDETMLWRVSVGSPLIGLINDEFVGVTLPVAMPHIALSPTARVLNHDTGRETLSAGLYVPTWPLRLNLWYGDSLPIAGRKRGVLHARAILFTTALAAYTFRICVDGRRRVKYVFQCGTAAGGGLSTFFENATLVPNNTVGNQLILPAVQESAAGRTTHTPSVVGSVITNEISPDSLGQSTPGTMFKMVYTEGAGGTTGGNFHVIDVYAYED